MRELHEIEAIVTRWRTEFERARRTLRYEDLVGLSMHLDECLAKLPTLIRALLQPAPPEPAPLEAAPAPRANHTVRALNGQMRAYHADRAQDRQMHEMSLQAVRASRALLATIRIH